MYMYVYIYLTKLTEKYFKSLFGKRKNINENSWKNYRLKFINVLKTYLEGYPNVTYTCLKWRVTKD